MSIEADELPDELVATLGSDRGMNFHFLDEEGRLDDLTGVVDCTLTIKDGTETVLERSSEVGTANASVDVANSAIVADPPTALEIMDEAVVTAVVVATKTITLAGDLTTVRALQPGGEITLLETGLGDALNAGTYTVVSSTLNAGDTDVVVEEDFEGPDETGITGTITFEAQVRPGRYVGYAAIKVGTAWRKTAPFFVNFEASEAPTF